MNTPTKGEQRAEKSYRNRYKPVGNPKRLEHIQNSIRNRATKARESNHRKQGDTSANEE